MTQSHGRAGRPGRSWLSTALAASGLCLALSAPRPAPACHIHHDHGQPSTTAEVSPSTTSTASEAPTGAVMKPWDDAAKPEPQVIAPTSASTTPATMPSVQGWHQSTACSCMPPTPPSTCGTPSTTASAQGIAPTPALKAPASLLNPPTPAPEPSTILTAVALAGAFAWRRRAARSRP